MQIKRRVVVAALCVGLGLISAGGFDLERAYATNHSNIKGKASETTIKKLASAQQRYEAAQEKLRDLTAQAELAQNNLFQTQQDLEQTQEEIKKTQDEISITSKKLAEAQELLAERVANNYKSGNVSVLSVILGASDFNDFVNRIYYMDRISEQDADIIATVKDLKTDLETKHTSLNARLEEKKQLEERQKQEKEKADELVTQQAKFTESLDDEVKELYAKKKREEEADRAAKIKAAEEAARKAAQNHGKNLPAGSKIPGKPSPNVVSNALRYLGQPYIWGANGPQGFDCSGLTSRAYAEAGISLPHSSLAQYNHVKAKGNLVTDPKLLVPGDLVFYYQPVHHVAIYIGNGQVVHAPTFGRTVSIDSLNMWGSFVGGGSW